MTSRWVQIVFLGSYTLTLVGAGALVLIRGAPLGAVTVGVQALAGVLLPSAIVFLVLLCNDKEVLGPWTNPPWLNVAATTQAAVLVALSLILATTTVFPDINAEKLAIGLAIAVIIGLAGFGIAQRLRRPAEQTARTRNETDRATWQMPPLATLQRPVMSTGRRSGLLVLRGYLVIAALMVVLKTFGFAG